MKTEQIKTTKIVDNPFSGATVKTLTDSLNYHAAYMDIMLYKEIESDIK